MASGSWARWLLLVVEVAAWAGLVIGLLLAVGGIAGVVWETNRPPCEIDEACGDAWVGGLGLVAVLFGAPLLAVSGLVGLVARWLRRP